MDTLLEAAEKEKSLQLLTNAEKNLLQCLDNGREANSGALELPRPTELSAEVSKQYTIRAKLITWLCSRPSGYKQYMFHGIRIKGYIIMDRVELNSLNIPFHLSLRMCFFPKGIDLTGANIESLTLTDSITAGIDADRLTVQGDILLNEQFSSYKSICLAGSIIRGNLNCSKGQINNSQCPPENIPHCGCDNCRSCVLYAYSLVLERAKITGSVYLCGGFSASGGVLLSDSRIEGNLNLTESIITAKLHKKGLKKKNGRRLACENDYDCRLACALNCDGMQVKGNLLLNGINIKGEMRLVGAHIEGDLEAARGIFRHRYSCAISADRLRVHGNVFFCDRFIAEGIIRLPSAEIGVDLSFFNSSLKYPCHDSPVLYCEGIKVQGNIYFNQLQADGSVALSNSVIGRDVNCTDCKFKNNGNKSLTADNAVIGGSVLLIGKALNLFEADGCTSFKKSEISQNLIFKNGHFKSAKNYAIEASSLLVRGDVQMEGINADGGIYLQNATIGNGLTIDGGIFKEPNNTNPKKKTHAIDANNLKIGRSVYFNNKFIIKGEVIFNDASIGLNFICQDGTIENRDGFAFRAQRMKVTASVWLNIGFKAYGKVNIEDAVIGLNLLCSKGKFINQKKRLDITVLGRPKEEQYALNAESAKIGGSVFLNNFFHANGGVSLKHATIEKNLDCSNGKFINPWKKLDSTVLEQTRQEQYALNAESAKIGGSVRLTSCFHAIGAVSLLDAIIEKNLDCSKGKFINPWKDPDQRNIMKMKHYEYALTIKGARIGRCAFFKNGFHAIGTVSLMSAEIGRYLVWKDLGSTDKLELDFRSARVDTLQDDQNTWPKQPKCIHLDAFEYKFLDNPKANNIRNRLKYWLNNQPHFHPQPYEHLAALLRRCGREEDAKVVLIEKNRVCCSEGFRWPKWIGNFFKPRSEDHETDKNKYVSFSTWLYLKLLGILVDYGYSPGKALRGGLCIIIIGMIFFNIGFEKGVMAPTKKVYQVDKATKLSLPYQTDFNHSLYSGPGFGYQLLNSFVYSLDVFLPVVDFKIGDNWIPTANQLHPSSVDHKKSMLQNREIWGQLLYMYRCLHIVLGWVITTVFLAALSGIVRR